MKHYFTILVASSLLLSSCSALVNYIGDKYPSTTTVDIFYSAHDVKKEYKVIGHLTYPNAGTDAVRSAMENYGKKIGADAIVIIGIESSKDAQSTVVTADALKYDK